MKFLLDNFRWVFAGAVLTFASCFGQTFFISIFADEIMNRFQISNGEWGAYYGIGTFASGILMIWAGGLTDHFRAKHLAIILLILMAGFATAMALNPYLVFLPVVIFGLRFCGQGMLFHIGMVAMTRWFTHARGKAISVATLGFSGGEAFLPLVFVSLMASLAWQKLWLLSAVIIILIIPGLLVLLAQERKPSEIAKETSSFGIGGAHWTRKDALTHPLFWMVVPAIMASSAFTTALFFQQVHLAHDKGWKHLEFVALFPAYTGLSVFFVIAYGWAIDRFKSRRLMAIFLLPMAFGFLILGNVSTLGGAMLALSLIAIMQGGSSTVPVAFWSEIYGTKFVGSIKAVATACMVFGSAIGPIVTGHLIDRGISLSDQTPAIATVAFLIALLTWVAINKYVPKDHR